MQQKRIKTKYPGIFYREINKNNKIDKTYYIVYKENGKTKEIKAGRESEGMRVNYANTLRISILNSIRLGGDLPQLVTFKTKQEVVTFDKIAYAYFDSKILHNKTNHRTKTKYESQLKPTIGHRNIYSITKNDLIKIQNEFAQSRAPKTVNQYIQFIRTVFNYAIEEGLFSGKNPANGIKEQKIDNKRERYLEANEVKLLLDNVMHDPNLYLFTLLSLTTGARLASIMSIHKKDIILEQNTINLQDHKNQTTYIGFFDDELKAIIKDHIKYLGANDPIIATNTRTLRRKMSKILTTLFNSELDQNDRKNRAVVHTLRHTFASQLAITETPIFTIKKLLNHKDIKQTLRYAKLSPSAGSDDVKKMMSIYKN